MDGIISINKEMGYTSNDVIAILRGILRMKKIGHTGTLDPDATGVLPVCLGKATKAAELLTAAEKEYEAQLIFGQETDTQDISGTVTRKSEYTFSEAVFLRAVQEMTGEIWQVPPMYSALKVGGVRLYDLAREGTWVEREPRKIRVEEIQVLELTPQGARIRVRCSKGTYIRTLCEDLGRKTGWLACMSALTRLRSGPFTLEDSLTLGEVKELALKGELESRILSVDRMFAQMPAFTVLPDQERKLCNGNPLEFPGELPGGTRIRVYTPQGKFAALYRVEKCRDAVLSCRAYKMF